MKCITLFILLSGILFAQNYTVEKLKGEAQTLAGTTENRVEVKEGTVLNPNSTLLVQENSLVQLKNIDVTFTLQGPAILTLSDLKVMSTDEVKLALSEDGINTPLDNEEIGYGSTTTYWTEENEKDFQSNPLVNYGRKLLNGAMQLASNGFEGSAVVAANEIYRKYPDTGNIPSYRIFFANVMFRLGLYQEALKEYSIAKELDLNMEDSIEVNERLNELSNTIVIPE